MQVTDFFWALFCCVKGFCNHLPEVVMAMIHCIFEHPVVVCKLRWYCAVLKTIVRANLHRGRASSCQAQLFVLLCPVIAVHGPTQWNKQICPWHLLTRPQCRLALAVQDRIGKVIFILLFWITCCKQCRKRRGV